jgi:DNA polymerase-3 subunit gamma/tau
LSELALYRKYRSQSFDAVIGQPQVVDTLKSAIASGRLSHAYLFTGPRGTGKTSVARLLARAVNCTAEEASVRPCGECSNCKIEIGAHLDLIEIDAASNRGIDDARALREKITSAPTMGAYKVYIIDEVHMLTTEAFNALLKTLEEPPSHAMFILATTEAHKLPETIISRTQRFSFKPIAANAMSAHLKEIAVKEGISIDDGALAIIAGSSRGGFRDAISLLDQAANSGSKGLTADSVRELLGQGDPAIMKAIMKAVRDQQPNKVLASLDGAWEAGIQPGQLARQLIEAWRAELKVAVGHEDGMPQVQLAVNAIDILIPVLRTTWPELALESALARLASASEAVEPVRPLTRQVAPTTSRPLSAKPQAGSKPEPAAQPAPSSAPPPSGAPSGDLWMKALTLIKQKNNGLYALLRSCDIRFDGDEVIIGCKFVFFRDRIQEGKNIETIEKILTRTYGRKFKARALLETKSPTMVPAAGDPSSELMSSALEILGGEVIHE